MPSGKDRFGWWAWAHWACSRISTPRVDVAEVDREVAQIVRESWLWACGAPLFAKLDAAWRESRCRAAVAWLAVGPR